MHSQKRATKSRTSNILFNFEAEIPVALAYRYPIEIIVVQRPLEEPQFPSMVDKDNCLLPVHQSAKDTQW
jgi:hypothetical protein